MVVDVLGFQNLDFEGQNGQRVKGINLFTAFVDEGVTGMRTDRFFLRDGLALPKDFKVNDEVTLYFDRKGRVEKIEKI